MRMRQKETKHDFDFGFCEAVILKMCGATTIAHVRVSVYFRRYTFYIRFVLFFMEHVHMYCTICCFCRPSQEVLQCFGVCAPDACKKLLHRRKSFGKSFACQRSD